MCGTLSFQADIEEMLVETQLAEDRAKKTMIDTARLAGMYLRKRPFSLEKRCEDEKEKGYN